MNRKDYYKLYKDWNFFLKESSSQNEKEIYQKLSEEIEACIKKNNIEILDIKCRFNKEKNIPQITRLKYLVNQEEKTLELSSREVFESVNFYQIFLNDLLRNLKKQQINIDYDKHDSVKVYGKSKDMHQIGIKVIKFDALMKMKIKIFDEWAKQNNSIDFSHYLVNAVMKDKVKFVKIGKVNSRNYVLVEGTKTDKNLCFYQRSGKGDSASTFLSKYRNDLAEGCWLPVGGLGIGSAVKSGIPQAAWVVKIPSSCDYVSDFQGEKFPKIFTEIYYIGIALKLRNISISNSDIDNISNSLNIMSWREYGNKIYMLSEKVKDEISLSLNYCKRVLPVRYKEMIVNLFLKENNAIKKEWFESYDKKSEKPVGINEEDLHKFKLDPNKEKFWINVIKIHNIEIFNKKEQIKFIDSIIDDTVNKKGDS